MSDESTGPATPLFPPFLDQGSKGGAVNFLAWVLKNVVGVSNADKIIYDGDYTPGGEIAKGVKNLQARCGFTGDDVDGNFGPKTRAVMKDTFGIDVEEVTLEMITAPTVAVGPLNARDRRACGHSGAPESEKSKWSTGYDIWPRRGN